MVPIATHRHTVCLVNCWPEVQYDFRCHLPLPLDAKSDNWNKLEVVIREGHTLNY